MRGEKDDGLWTLREHGFALVRDLIDKQAVARLSQGLDETLDRGSVGNHRRFSRSRYGLTAENDPQIARLLDSPSVAAALRQHLGDAPMAFSQAIGFELGADRAEGFGWHLDLSSFPFIMPADEAWSLWIPLCDIDPDGQGGGMAFAPRQLSWGQALGAVWQDANERGDADAAPGIYRRWRDGCADEVLERDRIEPAFRAGDAVLFSKFVFHRSCVLRPGPLASRRAISLRFLSPQARFNRMGLAVLEADGGYLNPGLTALAHGDSLAGAARVDRAHLSCLA